MLNKKVLTILAVVLVIGGYFCFGTSGNKLDLKDFDIEVITRGDILKVITANGTINPVNVVTVGTQVSGIVEKIFVDYNTPVKKGDKLAKIDTSILQKNVNEAKEGMDKARANYNYIYSNYKRDLNLFRQNYIAKVDLEQSETQEKNAKSDYNIAKSKYEIAKINLNYASINSPVAGVVISRQVDIGQTVAATLSAPTLFTIAEDLTQMQIETSISEADIGTVKDGLEVEFSVDTFPNEKFKGKITQIRLNPSSDSNVVVYNVIVAIHNDDLRLMPGMTAYVTIPTNEVKNVLKVNSVALRFSPDDELLKLMGVEKQEKQSGTVVVYKVEDTNNKSIKVSPVRVKRGLSNLSQTEVITDNLREGDKIISNSALLKVKRK